MRTITRLEQLPALTAPERGSLEETVQRYALRIPEEYLNLIDWSDPADPIRQLVVPREEEMQEWGRLDASNEAANTVARGVQHKYSDTVLLLCNEVCAGYCRYCFRKRLFMEGNGEVNKDVWEGLRYIEAHPEVTNVLLTGGDPLVLSTRRLREIIERVWAIPHVRVIRIGSKMPAFNPSRLLDDPELLDLLSSAGPDRRFYLMAHFDHPRELTPKALALLDRLTRAGVILANQCPLIRGVNDSPAVLAELFRRLSWAGCPPYYLFQGRPVAGNAPYTLPISEGWRIYSQAMAGDSGLARRARFVMSHESGKIEILGLDAFHLYMRYHRAKDASLNGQILRYRRDDKALWLDDLIPAPRMAWGEDRPHSIQVGYPPRPAAEGCARHVAIASSDGGAQVHAYNRSALR